MGVTDNGFRARAGSLLHSSNLFRGQSTSPEPNSVHGTHLNSTPPLSPSTIGNCQLDGAFGQELSSPTITNDQCRLSSFSDTIEEDKATQRFVRLVPTWARLPLEEDEDTAEDQSSELLPKPPVDAQVAHHNSNPSPKNKTRHEVGHRYDKEREWTPPIPREHIEQTGSRWRVFADVSTYPPPPEENRQHVTEEWLLENGADYSQPWRPEAGDEGAEKHDERSNRRLQRMVWGQRMQRVILRNPMVPLIIRMVVWWFSLIALILGASIYNFYRRQGIELGTIASPEMAIIVDAVALVYIFYITYDEYRGKPLGLRSAKAKLRLIFLDLFFIVFDSANLSLAFKAIEEASELCKPELGVCAKQRALASVLLVALIAWLMTFAISVLRLIERVVPG